MKGRPKPAPHAETDGLDLEAMIHVRVSTQVKDLVRERAAKAGLEPSTWVRVQLVKLLGLDG